MTGLEKPDDGSAALVGQNVVMSYFEQNQADALDLNKTVIETIQGASSGQSYNELRALLGQFLFKGDSVEKKVCYLSGGEKARLSLCCMMLTPANLLILDEPTNRKWRTTCSTLACFSFSYLVTHTLPYLHHRFVC
jgi:ATP-binding cassette, subfamily F, member 3